MDSMWAKLDGWDAMMGSTWASWDATCLEAERDLSLTQLRCLNDNDHGCTVKLKITFPNANLHVDMIKYVLHHVLALPN